MGYQDDLIRRLGDINKRRTDKAVGYPGKFLGYLVVTETMNITNQDLARGYICNKRIYTEAELSGVEKIRFDAIMRLLKTNETRASRNGAKVDMGDFFHKEPKARKRKTS